jgi:hypothetical protein
MWMSESWQDWSDPQFHEFLTQFYGNQILFARSVVKNAVPKAVDSFIPLTVAVFEKVAPPAVYLKAEYDRWLHDDTGLVSEAEAKAARETSPPPTPQPKTKKGIVEAEEVYASEGDWAISELVPRLQKELLISEVKGETRIALKRFLADRQDWITINNHLRARGFTWTKNGKEGYWKR